MVANFLGKMFGRTVDLPHLRVRNASTVDAPLVSEIYNEGLPDPGVAGPLHENQHARFGEADAARWIARHQCTNRPLWLASVGSTTVAWLTFLGFHERPGCEQTCELGIQVRQSWRARGVARELATRAVGAAPGLGFDRLVAFVRADNTASIALCTGHGFEPWGCCPGAVVHMGIRRDLLIYGRCLDGAVPRRRPR